MTQEHKDKIGLANKGKRKGIVYPQAIEAMRKANLGHHRKHSKKTKEKLKDIVKKEMAG